MASTDHGLLEAKRNDNIIVGIYDEQAPLTTESLPRRGCTPAAADQAQNYRFSARARKN